MTTKLHTLRKQAEISDVFRRGLRARGRLVRLVALRRPGHPPRVLFSVSRKVGNAVVRNRLRRRLREILRVLMGDLVEGCDVAVVASPGAGQATYEALRREVASSLRKIGVLRLDEGNG